MSAKGIFFRGWSKAEVITFPVLGLLGATAIMAGPWVALALPAFFILLLFLPFLLSHNYAWLILYSFAVAITPAPRVDLGISEEVPIHLGLIFFLLGFFIFLVRGGFVNVKLSVVHKALMLYAFSALISLPFAFYREGFMSGMGSALRWTLLIQAIFPLFWASAEGLQAVNRFTKAMLWAGILTGAWGIIRYSFQLPVPYPQAQHLAWLQKGRVYTAMGVFGESVSFGIFS